MFFGGKNSGRSFLTFEFFQKEKKKAPPVKFKNLGLFHFLVDKSVFHNEPDVLQDFYIL